MIWACITIFYDENNNAVSVNYLKLGQFVGQKGELSSE